jgi:hypothetical protein
MYPADVRGDVISPAMPAPDPEPSAGDAPARGRSHRPGRIWVTTWIVAIVALLAIAGVADWGILSNPTAPPAPPPAGWMTFHQAAPVAQQVANSLIVGPWALAFAAGVAADGPWAPTIYGTFGTTPPCADKLSGISLFTYWNDSEYPVSHAPTIFSSGTAPLWSFGYVDPAGDTAIVSVVNGTGVYNGLWLVSTGCAMPLDSSYRPGFSPSAISDSSQVAATVMGLPAGWLAPTDGTFPPFDPANPGPAFEMYSLGPWADGAAGSELNVGSPGTDHLPSWFDTWGRCGLAGAAGNSPSVVELMNATTGRLAQFGSNSVILCQSVGAAGALSAPTVGIPPGPTGTFESWTLSVSASTSTVPSPNGWNVLTTSSITPVLSTNSSSGGTPFTAVVPSGAALCGVGTGHLSECIVNPAGWYAVLTDAHGNWLDSFPSQAGGSNWTRSGVTVSSGDAIEILLPAETPTVKLFELLYTGWDGEVGTSYIDL